MTVRSLISVHRPRYFRFCNVLHMWTIRAIPTYRVYRLYDHRMTMNHKCYNFEIRGVIALFVPVTSVYMTVLLCALYQISTNVYDHRIVMLLSLGENKLYSPYLSNYLIIIISSIH